MKETEEDTNNGKMSHVHGLEELILLKCPYYPEPFTDSMNFECTEFLSKFQLHFSRK